MNRREGMKFLREYFDEQTAGLGSPSRLAWLLTQTDEYLQRFVGIFLMMLDQGISSDEELIRGLNRDELYMWACVAADLATTFSSKNELGLEYDANWNEFVNALADLPQANSLADLPRLRLLIKQIVNRWC